MRGKNGVTHEHVSITFVWRMMRESVGGVLMAVHDAMLMPQKSKYPQLSREEQCIVDILDSYLSDRPISEELFPDGFDINEFISVASRHEVLLIICQILSASKAQIDPSIYSKIQAILLRSRIHDELMRSEFRTILQKLNRHCIIPLVLKGFATQSRYPHGLLRDFNDIDLQMHNEDLAKAHKILLELGYSTIGSDSADFEKRLYDQNVSPHLARYVKRLTYGFTYIVEFHRLDFYAFRGVPSKSLYRAAQTAVFDENTMYLRHTDPDLIIYSFLHFIRHENLLLARVRTGLRLFHLLDGCILLKEIIPKLGWETLLKRINELKIAPWMYYAFLRARTLCESLIPQWVISHLQKQSEGAALNNHPVTRNFIDYNWNFLEQVIRPEKEMERMTAHTRKLREAGVCGEVYCFRGSNPELITKISAHPNSLVIIDEQQVPDWNFYRTFVSRAGRISELRRVEAAFSWDEEYLYSHIDIDHSSVSNPTFNCLLDVIYLEFYNESGHWFSCRIAFNKDGTPKIIIRDVSKGVPIPFIGVFETRSTGYALDVRIPVALLNQHFGFTPHETLKLGFNLSLSDFSDEGVWTENRLDWGLPPAYGHMIFTSKEF